MGTGGATNAPTALRRTLCLDCISPALSETADICIWSCPLNPPAIGGAICPFKVWSAGALGGAAASIGELLRRFALSLCSGAGVVNRVEDDGAAGSVGGGVASR